MLIFVHAVTTNTEQNPETDNNHRFGSRMQKSLYSITWLQERVLPMAQERKQMLHNMLLSNTSNSRHD